MPPESRRAYLTLLGTVGTAGVAGCIGSPGSSADGEANPPENSPSSMPTSTEAPSSNPSPSELPAGPLRCEGEPVSVEQTVTDESGYGDNMEYFPGNQTVRIVTVRSGDEPKGFAEWPFEEWATFETADVAKPRAVDVTAGRLGSDEFGSGVGRPPDSAEADDVVVWLHLSTRVEDGEVISTPTLSLEELVQRAPRSVAATVSLEDDTFSRSVPVFADHSRVSFGGDGG